MILTDKLKLKKPDQDDFIDVDDINHNTDIIDEVLGEGNKHVISKLLSKEGAHGLRVIKRSLQVYDQGKWKTINSGGLNYVAPDNMRKFNAEISERNKVKLTFLEPLDTMLEDDIVSKVAGVMIRYSTETYPETIKQGNLAINNLQLGKYENNPFELTDLKYNTTYYFTAFPYSDMELYNTSVTNQNRLMIKTEEIEAVAPNNMRKFEATPQGDGLLLKFQEPEDTIIDGEVASKVVGVMIRYSTVSHPTTIEEGTLAIDNKQLGKYKTNGFELKGLSHLNTYYISAFPYSDKNLYNTENNASNRVSGTPLGAEQVSVVSNMNCLVDISIGNNKYSESLSSQIPFQFNVNKGVVYKIEPEAISNKYKTPDVIVKTAVAGDNTNINLNYEKIKILNDYSWAEIIQLHTENKLKEVIDMSKAIDGGKAYKRDDDYGQTWNVASVSGAQVFFYLYKGAPLFATRLSAPYGATSSTGEDIQEITVRAKNGSPVTITANQNAVNETDKLQYKVANHFSNLFAPEIRQHVRAYGLTPYSSAELLYGFISPRGYSMYDYSDIERKFIEIAYIKNKSGKTQIICIYQQPIVGDETEVQEYLGNSMDLHSDTILPFMLVLER